MIEIIEPYPEESFFSWLHRMVIWQGFNTKEHQKNRGTFMKALFGPDTKEGICLYAPSDLDYFIRAVNLPSSNYFSSVDQLLDKMTVYPFYKCFLTDEQKDRLLKLFSGHNVTVNTERRLGVRAGLNYYESEPRIKFCMECLKEHKMIFTKAEHQIQGNNMCYKHSLRLQYITYSCQNGLDFTKHGIGVNDMPYCITEDTQTLQVNTQVTEIIHRIFKGELKDSLIVIKSKLRKRMKELKHLDNNDRFVDLNSFKNIYEEYTLNKFEIDEVLICFYDFNKKINSIILIYLILLLFHRLDYYLSYPIYEYEIISKPNSVALATYNKQKSDEDCLDYYRKLIEANQVDIKVIQAPKRESNILIQCRNCGNVDERTKAEARSRNGKIICRSCFPKKNMFEQKKKVIEEKYPEFECVESYIEDKNRLIVRHRQCNCQKTVYYSNAKRGLSCPVCKGNEKLKKLGKVDFEIVDYSSKNGYKVLHKTCHKRFYLKSAKLINNQLSHQCEKYEEK